MPPRTTRLLFALASNAGLPHLSKASPYKSYRRFTPVATIGGNTSAGGADRSPASHSPIRAYAKANRSPLMRGANNVSEDMGGRTGEQRSFGQPFQLGTLQGCAPQLLPDLLEGRIQVAVLPVRRASVPHAKAGRLTCSRLQHG